MTSQSVLDFLSISSGCETWYIWNETVGAGKDTKVSGDDYGGGSRAEDRSAGHNSSQLTHQQLIHFHKIILLVLAEEFGHTLHVVQSDPLPPFE